jgi:hypothetical protein
MERQRARVAPQPSAGGGRQGASSGAPAHLQRCQERRKQRRGLGRLGRGQEEPRVVDGRVQPTGRHAVRQALAAADLVKQPATAGQQGNTRWALGPPAAPPTGARPGGLPLHAVVWLLKRRADERARVRVLPAGSPPPQPPPHPHLPEAVEHICQHIQRVLVRVPQPDARLAQRNAALHAAQRSKRPRKQVGTDCPAAAGSCDGSGQKGRLWPKGQPSIPG